MFTASDEDGFSRDFDAERDAEQGLSRRWSIALVAALLFLLCYTGYLINDPRLNLFAALTGTRTLVILIGQARGSEYAWRSLEWNLLRPYGADLATYFTTASPQTMLQRMAKFNWVLPEYSNWATLFEQVAAQCPQGPQDDSWQQLCPLGTGELQWMGGVNTTLCQHPGSAGILLAFRWAVQQKLLELKLDQQYDRFILSRADELHLCAHYPLDRLDSSRAWYPNGEEWGGVSDRHMFAYRDVFLRSMNITTELVCNWRAYIRQVNSTHYPKLEMMITMVAFHPDSHSQVRIGKYERSMFTVKRPSDPTRWSNGSALTDAQEFGLLIKYPTELTRAKKYCRVNNIRPLLGQLKEENERQEEKERRRK